MKTPPAPRSLILKPTEDSNSTVQNGTPSSHHEHVSSSILAGVFLNPSECAFESVWRSNRQDNSPLTERVNISKCPSLVRLRLCPLPIARNQYQVAQLS